RGHMFGENEYDYLAPSIYEGEGEMLGMSFFKPLIKDHGKAFFEPIGREIQAAGIKRPNPWKPSHAWALPKALLPYVEGRIGEFSPPAGRADARANGMPPRLAAHAEFAAKRLQRSRTEISNVMIKHQLRLADRQCRIAEISQRLQDLVVMLVTS